MHISDVFSRLPTHNTQVGNKQEIKGLKVSIGEVSPVQTDVSLHQFRNIPLMTLCWNNSKDMSWKDGQMLRKTVLSN